MPIIIRIKEDRLFQIGTHYKMTTFFYLPKENNGDFYLILAILIVKCYLRLSIKLNIMEREMTKLSISQSAKSDTKVIFIAENGKKSLKDFEGKTGELSVRYEKNETSIYCGIGPKKDCNEEILRTAAANAIRKAKDLKRTKVSIIDPKHKGKSQRAIMIGALLATYTYAKHLSEKPVEIKAIDFVSDTATTADTKKVQSICEGVFLARNLINGNAHDVYPQILAAEAKKIAASATNITCTVLTEKEIDKKGLGLLKAVGQASKFPPRLVILQYKGDKNSKENKTIVGKGITFDSGGLNLKPTGSIETMRCDMSGSAAVLGTMKALSLLKPKINVTGVVAAAHSAIGSDAFFPGDVYKSYSGKTVEIKNTDAEGRLVLADAISYVQKHFAPTEIIDLATLTGAIVISLGDLCAGIFSNNDKLAENLTKAGVKTAEKLWRMPLTKDHIDAMKGDISDLRNLSKLPPRHAGSSTAAAFLNSFIENELPWAHLDIAGTAFNERDARGEIPKYATGFGVRLLVNYLTD